MKSFIHIQPVLVFLRKMRPDSLQTWQIILFDVNLCRKKCLPQRNTHSSLFLCLSFWKQHMRFRQYVTPPFSSRGKCILRFGLSDFFFFIPHQLLFIYLFIIKSLCFQCIFLLLYIVTEYQSTLWYLPSQVTLEGDRIHPPL